METTITKEELLQQIKAAVLSKDPSATVMLYGSRARGDAQPDSDWDILVLTDGQIDFAYQSSIRNAIYKIELECGEVLSTVFFSREKWNSPKTQLRPFNKNILDEGLVI